MRLRGEEMWPPIPNPFFSMIPECLKASHIRLLTQFTSPAYQPLDLQSWLGLFHHFIRSEFAMPPQAFRAHGWPLTLFQPVFQGISECQLASFPKMTKSLFRRWHRGFTHTAAVSHHNEVMRSNEVSPWWGHEVQWGSSPSHELEPLDTKLAGRWDFD